ncbi:MAG: DUF5683 domain-containing protein [candidate division Zixibacteria bacterium]|nr:DUF5683 domain-containing protein [candidate division Zixibacteria bacterium]
MLQTKLSIILAAVLMGLAAGVVADGSETSRPTGPLLAADSVGQILPPDTAATLIDTTAQALPSDTAAPPKDSIVSDSVVLEPTLYQFGGDTILVQAYEPTTKDRAHKISPTIIMFKSVVFPGWGQWSNHKYIKAGAVFVIESYFIYKYIHFAGKASDWRDRWQAIPVTETTQREAAFVQYADYRDSRNSNLWATGITIFLSMFDAYVDAHLRDFPPPVAGQTTVSWKTAPGNGAAVTLTYHF